MRAKVPVELKCEQCQQSFVAGRRDARFCGAMCRSKAARNTVRIPEDARTGGRAAVRSARALIVALGEMDEADTVLATALLQISEIVDAHPSAALFRELRGIVDALAGRAA
jgi:hypothetical protein